MNRAIISEGRRATPPRKPTSLESELSGNPSRGLKTLSLFGRDACSFLDYEVTDLPHLTK